MSYMMSYTIWNTIIIIIVTISHTLRHDIFHISCMLLKQDMPERSITECLSWYIPSIFGSNFGYKAWQLVGLFSLAGKLSIRIEWSSVRVLSMIYWVSMVEVEQKADKVFFLVCTVDPVHLPSRHDFPPRQQHCIWHRIRCRIRYRIRRRINVACDLYMVHT